MKDIEPTLEFFIKDRWWISGPEVTAKKIAEFEPYRRAIEGRINSWIHGLKDFGGEVIRDTWPKWEDFAKNMLNEIEQEVLRSSGRRYSSPAMQALDAKFHADMVSLGILKK